MPGPLTGADRQSRYFTRANPRAGGLDGIIRPMTITIKTAEDVAGMRVACRLASEVLDYIGPFIKPGVTTNEIDKLCHDYMVYVQQ